MNARWNGELNAELDADFNAAVSATGHTAPLARLQQQPQQFSFFQAVRLLQLA